MQVFDVVIAGGGMVGALVANLLAKQKLSVLVIDRFDIFKVEFDQKPCLRTSAFNRLSQELLVSLDVWRYVDEKRQAPYLGLETWEDENFPLKFSAKEVGAEYLGNILENNLVQKALWQNFEHLNVELCCPASIVTLKQNSVDDQIEIELDNGETVAGRLLVGADGAQSKVRQLAHIGTDGWQYGQHCMAVNVQMDESHPPVTWQQFYPTGPRAYLPLFERYASLIWYDQPDTIRRLSQLSDSKLKAEIQQAFPSRLGDFTILDKGVFPLSRMHAKSYYAQRMVLVGDAAHTINPLAGQGVNLGFKDAKQLAQTLGNGLKSGLAINDEVLLKQYHQARYKDNLLMMSLMDLCYFGFSNEIKPLAKLRNLGLSIANRAGPVKKQVLKHAMGW